MSEIISRDNLKLKYARKVRDGSVKDAIFLEGLRLAQEINRSNLKIAEIFFTENFVRDARGRDFLDNAATSNLRQISDKLFASISDTKNSQGIAVIAEKPATGKSLIEGKLNFQKAAFPLIVLLHQINNPSNLGAILRICEAVNVAGVILTKNSADAFSPKALRGAMGASLRIPLWTNADFFEALNWAKANKFTSFCADVNAEKSYLETNWKRAGLIIFGSEAHGLSEKERAQIDESLIIPMENGVESLNLAVSCGVILFEARKYRI